MDTSSLEELQEKIHKASVWLEAHPEFEKIAEEQSSCLNFILTQSLRACPQATVALAGNLGELSSLSLCNFSSFCYGLFIGYEAHRAESILKSLDHG